MVEEQIDSLIMDFHQSKKAHQQRLRVNFHAMMNDVQKERTVFESHHSSFMTDIRAKLRAIEEVVDETVISIGSNFASVNKALTTVQATTKMMTGLLEENRSQLHQLRDNKAAWVTAMQEHRDCLDNINAILTHVTDSVMKSSNLAHELDSKLSAYRPATPPVKRPCPVDQPPAPSFVSPAQTSTNKGTCPSSVESDPGHALVPPAGPAPNRFGHVRLGNPILRASSYPSGNRPASDNFFESTRRPTPVDTSESPDDPCQGGCIASPRPSDKEQQARQRQLSIFNIVGLASPLYHGDVDGVPELSVSFIYACGYQSFSPETPNDVLLCYRDIQQLHKKAKISAVRSELKNGYDLFWRILELAVPGFDPTITIEPPKWTRDTDILEFCHGHELYFRLLAKKKMFYDSQSRTNMFLRGITLSEYADVITTLKSNIDMYRHADDDGFLPQHLRLNGIATMLHDNAKARVHNIGTPQLHMTRGYAPDLG